MKFARKRLDTELAKRQAGVSKTIDVLDAQDALSLAASAKLRAIVDHSLSLIRLQREQGTLLDTVGVTVALGAGDRSTAHLSSALFSALARLS